MRKYPAFFPDLAESIYYDATLMLSLIHILGKAVDSGDDVSCILAQTIEDDAQRGLSCFIGGSCDTDCTLSSCKGFVTCQETEAVGLFPQQHCAQVTMSQTCRLYTAKRKRTPEGSPFLYFGNALLYQSGR